MSSERLSDEDAKLVTLARGARSRVGAATGAAIRDETGRTYSAADVALPSLTLTALQLAVAVASASGSRGVECAVVVTSDPTAPIDTSALTDLGGADAMLHVCGPDGTVAHTTVSGPSA